ncbi:peroxiredoxin [Lysobacter pythonis]|uniref:Glutathione-dependent peroxiredoxin n=1 Tax=Solilutibacter pythonis TaxID=2483112 RepID=A0A3M2HZ25_9GAMM|nr:peroxiredoxin [Lysobacter pythonis]RMH91094.1 peroxiredoxin [Lysobacter pythonis]
MSIQPGQQIPEAVLQTLRDGMQKIDTRHLFEGKRAVLFAVPGAFTPTCSERHLPGYVEHVDEFTRRGIELMCLSVNDPFVMQAWGEAQKVPPSLWMLADGNGDFTRALGLEMDASAYGMGLRSKRFALYVEDGVVRDVQVEAPGEFKVSGAEHMLSRLPD